MQQFPNQMIDPAAASLHILLVDANQKSRQANEILLNGCNYQVTACKTSQEALQVLKAQEGPEGAVSFDLILKEHCPSSGTNTSRFLRRAQTEQLLRGIPVIVISATEDSELMANCLQLGAADFMLKPLRASELRNLWARVYWWRRAMYHEPANVSSHQLASGSGSERTRENSAEPQEALNGVGVGGTETDTTQQDRYNDSAEPSKESKDNVDWSGTMNNGHSKLNTQQGSNDPSKTSVLSQPHVSPCTGTTPFPACNQLSQTGKATPAPRDSTGLNVGGQHKNTATNADQKFELGNITANAGFRAYVPSEQQKEGLKRSLPEASSREDPGSSGSDWTGSLEKFEQNKRQAVQGSLENGFNSLGGLALLTQQWLQHQQNHQAFPDRAKSLPQPQPNQCQPINSAHNEPKSTEPARSMSEQPSQTVASAFPFCLVPGMMQASYGSPSFWNQPSSSSRGSQGMSMPPGFPPYNNVQQPGADQDANTQQQRQVQQAMHNQIMYHHNLLLQQMGMTSPFMQYSAFPNAANKPNKQDLTQRSSMPAPVQVQHHDSQSNIPNSSSQVFMSGRTSGPIPDGFASGLTQHPSKSIADPAPAQQRVADSTTDTANRKSSTAPNGLDGYMLEPSRKQRRAEALHKYKQKRKNLNFTKKIRYESRKQLAQARPRVKGQFVRICSEDVNAAVDSLTPAQIKGVADGTADVTALLMENAKKAADEAGPLGPTVKSEDSDGLGISKETESEVAATAAANDEDASSPVSKRVQAPFLDPKVKDAAREVRQGNLERRNSSESGSNFQDAPC